MSQIDDSSMRPYSTPRLRSVTQISDSSLWPYDRLCHKLGQLSVAAGTHIDEQSCTQQSFSTLKAGAEDNGVEHKDMGKMLQ